MSKDYFSSVTTESKFKSMYKNTVLHELATAAGSAWGREHLFACHVIRQSQQNPILPTLATALESTRVRDIANSVAKTSSEILGFVTGPADFSHLYWSEHRLAREYGASLGYTWAALACVLQHTSVTEHIRDAPSDSESAMDLDSNPPGTILDQIDLLESSPSISSDEDEQVVDQEQASTRRSGRQRVKTQDPDFADSSQMVVGSSPLRGDDHQEASQSSRVSSLQYILRSDHTPGGPSEHRTLHLASCIIRHVLCHCQPEGHDSVVEFRVDHRLRSFKLSSNVVLSAADDGGLCLRRPMGSHWRSRDIDVALLEAKARFKDVDDGKAILSDEYFAQMTCEALVTALGQRHVILDTQHVIVVCAVKHYMCFLDFEISNDYLDGLQNTSFHEKEQFLYVDSTQWYDIRDEAGRMGILANIYGIVALSQQAYGI